MKSTAKQRAYQKAYYRKNRAKILKRNRQYDIEHKETIAAYQKEYHEANREKHLKRMRDYYAKNKLKAGDR